jgi:hypothetical protein
MNKIGLALSFVATTLAAIATVACGGSPAQIRTDQASAPAATQSSPATGAGAVASGDLRNENWLLGTWEATVPKSDTSHFAGKKARLIVNGAHLISSEKVQGNPTGKYAYTGSMVWDIGGAEKTIPFTETTLTEETPGLLWNYASPGANQFLENVSMRIYGDTLSFELDWGPQMSKPGSTYQSLSFYGSIQNTDTSDRDEFPPSNMVKFTRTGSSTGAPSTRTVSSTGTKTTAATKATSTTKTTTPAGGVTDLWSDIPVYTGARPAEDSGFGLTVQGDPSFPNAEWRFYDTADGVEKVSEFYKTQMKAKGWTRESWADLGEMQYGSFQKNNETRRCLIYVIQSEDKTGINTLSTSK